MNIQEQLDHMKKFQKYSWIMHAITWISMVLLLLIILSGIIHAQPFQSIVMIENSTNNFTLNPLDNLGQHNLNTMNGKTGRGQCFTLGISSPNVSYVFTQLSLLANHTVAPNGTFTDIHITRANGTCFPYGSDIANATVNNSKVGEGWVNITLKSYAPANSQSYFFWVNTSEMLWTTNFSFSNPYRGGRTLKWNLTQWNEDTSEQGMSNDLYFAVYGYRVPKEVNFTQ